MSVMLHVMLAAALSFGIPYFAKEPIEMEQAITVEIADMAEISQTPNIDAPEEREDEIQAPAERKPVYNTGAAPPDLLTPQAPDIAEEVPLPPEEVVKPEERVIKKPPKPTSKPNKPKPKPKILDKPEEDVKTAPEKDITSLLKSLTLDNPETEPAQQPQDFPDNQARTSQIADFSQDLTRSERDDLNRGVQPCWNVNAGGKYAEDLVVSLRVFINTDMNVRDVQILDSLRYASDTHFRAAADAARRALLNPRCSKLHLPPEKYEQWKVFIYHFDPSHML